MTARISHRGMEALEVHSALAEKGDGTAVRSTAAWWGTALLLCNPGRVLYYCSERMHIQGPSRGHGQKEALHKQLWSLLLPLRHGHGAGEGQLRCTQRPSPREPAMPTWEAAPACGCPATQHRRRPQAPAVFLAHPSAMLPNGPMDLGTRVPPGSRYPQVPNNLSLLKESLA